MKKDAECLCFCPFPLAILWISSRRCCFVNCRIITISFLDRIKMTDLDSTEIISADESLTENSSTTAPVCNLTFFSVWKVNHFETCLECFTKSVKWHRSSDVWYKQYIHYQRKALTCRIILFFFLVFRRDNYWSRKSIWFDYFCTGRTIFSLNWVDHKHILLVTFETTCQNNHK